MCVCAREIRSGEHSPLSLRSMYSAACSRAAMLIFPRFGVILAASVHAHSFFLSSCRTLRSRHTRRNTQAHARSTLTHPRARARARTTGAWARMKGEGHEIRNRDVFGRRAAPPRAIPPLFGYPRTRNCAHQRARAPTTMTTRTDKRGTCTIRGRQRRRRRQRIEMDTRKASSTLFFPFDPRVCRVRDQN